MRPALLHYQGDDDRKLYDFLQYARDTILRAIEVGERPMRALGDRANMYERIGIIGAYVIDNRINILTPDDQNLLRLPNFGIIGTSGSGNLQLRTRIQNAMQVTNPRLSPSQFTVQIGRNVCAERLADELEKEYVRPDWGGYLEQLWYDSRSSSWRRIEKTLFLRYSAFDIRGNVGPFFQAGKVICYDPNSGSGRLLSVANSPELQCVVDYSLIDLLDGKRSDIDSDAQWSDFYPDRVIVSAMIITDRTARSLVPGRRFLFNFENEDSIAARFRMGNGRFHIDINRDVLEELFEKAKGLYSSVIGAGKN